MSEIPQLQDGERQLDGDEFAFSQMLVRDAGELMRTMRDRGGYAVEWKPDGTPVTGIDLASNDLIVDKIQARWPNDRIWGEEKGAEAVAVWSGRTWVGDPTDGTQDQEQLGQASLALVALTDADGRPIFGTAYNPYTDELFAARIDDIATLNGKPLRVSGKSEIKRAAFYLGSKIQIVNVATNGTIYDRLESLGGKVFNRRALGFGCLQ